MTFLAGPDLTGEMQRLVASRSELKIAIAYWGRNALSLLDLDPKRPELKVVCCLSGGKSDPAVIELFHKRTRQNDKLHAKVIWTPKGAIVGSANASSNGLPEEESAAIGLVEAGVFLDDEEDLAKIEAWFDKQYDEARTIEPSDLEEAKQARANRPPTNLNAIASGTPGKQDIADTVAPATDIERRFVEYIEDLLDPGLKERLTAVFDMVMARSSPYRIAPTTPGRYPQFFIRATKARSVFKINTKTPPPQTAIITFHWDRLNGLPQEKVRSLRQTVNKLFPNRPKTQGSYDSIDPRKVNAPTFLLLLTELENFAREVLRQDGGT
jgi:hypothetical protein